MSLTTTQKKKIIRMPLKFSRIGSLHLLFPGHKGNRSQKILVAILNF